MTISLKTADDVSITVGMTVYDAGRKGLPGRFVEGVYAPGFLRFRAYPYYIPHARLYSTRGAARLRRIKLLREQCEDLQQQWTVKNEEIDELRGETNE